MSEQNDWKTAWAIVECMGHSTYAGLVSTITVAGQQMLRIDVPAVNDCQEWTRIVGPGSVYAITPVSEEVATERARSLKRIPVHSFDLPEDTRQAIHEGRRVLNALPAPADDDNDDNEGW